MNFPPPRRAGLILHSLLALLLLGGSAGCLWLALKQAVGSYFLLLLLVSLVLLPPAVLAVYRGYALLRANYTLNRDGLQIRWGLRGEDIPLLDIQWVRPADAMGFRLPLPWFWFPGAILGTRSVEGLGVVEFLASDRRRLLLVATPQRVFGVSPIDPDDFTYAFMRTVEMGSLTPIEPHSTVPTIFLQSVWSDRAARWLLALGLALTLVLLVTASLLAPNLKSVALGYTARGQPVEAGPPEKLLLLPTLAGMTFGANLLLGLMFYRIIRFRPVAYLLWASSITTPLLLLLAILVLVF